MKHGQIQYRVIGVLAMLQRRTLCPITHKNGPRRKMDSRFILDLAIFVNIVGLWVFYVYLLAVLEKKNKRVKE